MADEETIRRVVREELMIAGRNNPSNLYSATQRMIREASSSAIAEAALQHTPTQQMQRTANDNAPATSPTRIKPPNDVLRPIQQLHGSTSNAAPPKPLPFMKSKPYRLKPYKKVPHPHSSKEKIKILEVILLEEVSENYSVDEKYKVSEDLVLGTWMYDLVPNKSKQKFEKC